VTTFLNANDSHLHLAPYTIFAKMSNFVTKFFAKIKNKYGLFYRLN